jgi:hypothetical protein
MKGGGVDQRSGTVSQTRNPGASDYRRAHSLIGMLRESEFADARSCQGVQARVVWTLPGLPRALHGGHGLDLGGHVLRSAADCLEVPRKRSRLDRRQMFEIGNSLREARLRQGLDFPEIEQATKIRPKYLRALEDEQFDILPGQTYVKGFLRSYAEYLGLDGQLYVDEYNSRYVSGEEETPFRGRRSYPAPRARRRRAPRGRARRRRPRPAPRTGRARWPRRGTAGGGARRRRGWSGS